MARGKKRSEIGGERQFTHLGTRKPITHRIRGGDKKIRLLAENECNVYDPSKKKMVRTKILTVKANPSNPNYVQRNIITKGAIVGTDLGDALITSRPGQHGALNATLLPKK